MTEHAIKAAQRLIALVKRKMPGVQTKIVSINFDTQIGVGFLSGHHRHGLIVKDRTRVISPKFADKIVRIMRNVRRTPRSLPRIRA